MFGKAYEVGIYCRLSRDDRERQVVSMSIASRKMLQDIEKGRINCAVTKDLSRIGRNYVKTGFYTEEYFVEHHVRFIAVNDNVNAEKEYNDMAPFQNIMNEFYPKEISKKVRQVKRAWAMEGAFMGSQASYGYQKSPEDKHKLIVDEPAARAIRDVFQRLLDGDSARCIVEQLNARGTDTPSVYQYRRNGKLPPENRDNLWSSELIISLARNPVCLGHMIQCKRENVSFKSKQRKVVPEEDWVRVNNTHEPLIDQQEWDKMQLNIAERRVARSEFVCWIAPLLRLRQKAGIQYENAKEGSKKDL